MKDRIAHIMRAKNLKATDFATLLGIQPSGVSHILSGRNNPSLEFVKKIKETFPEYNLDWIIFGTGPMTNSEPYRDSFVEAQKEANRSSFGDGNLPPVDPSSSGFSQLVPPQSSQTDLFSVPADPPLTSSIPVEDPPLPSDSSHVKSMLILYDDGTFETFIPR